jgi:uncharacterized membrane protein YphA (DoxX/SURF4 family)
MKRNKLLNFFIAVVWFVNGFFCKVLNLVPRHQEIVSRNLGNSHSHLLTILIGFSEVAMAAWILSGRWTRLSAATQILVIAVMNTIEFNLAPDLLLWGRLNALFAFIFILVIYYNEFYLRRKLVQQT